MNASRTTAVRLFTIFFCPLFVLILSGCGGSTAESPDVELQPVSGIIKFKEEPLGQAAVTFVPEGASTTMTYFGTTDAEGKFVLKNRQAEAGCEAGKYKVIISKRVMPDGSPMPQEDSPEGAAAAAASTELLPAKYSSPQGTELVYEVPSGGKEFEISLTE